MLKPGGVIAVCIDDNELFHLGMVMDEIFGEENRLAIINWQKTTPKGARHAVTTTEYVLVYARDRELARTGLLPRSEKADARFQNQDHDPVSTWKQGDLTGKRSPTSHTNMLYAVQSPFTGKLLYPPENRHWAFEKAKIKGWLEEWGPKYEDRDLKDGRTKALVIKGAPVPDDPRYSADHPALVAARKKAKARLDAGAWPRLYFGKTGTAKPMYKVYASEVRAGSIPTTFWLEEESIDRLEQLGSMSWAATESGRSREGLEELDEIVGKRHGFETVKPLSLITKLIQIWCPPGGIVLDPYAGSGTVGQAVLALNAATDAGRRFILIEQGAPSAGDKYARSLTWLRLKNAVTGERPNGRKTAALGGGFEFRVLTRTIDAKTVMAMKRDELIDVVITSHWTSDRRGAPTLRRVDDDAYKHLVGLDDTGASYFVLWSQEEGVGQLDMQTYREVLAEAKSAGLSTPFNVYARYELYQSPHVRFWKIPDKILAHLGLNEEAIYHDVADAPDVEGVVAA
jgi:adenine-specific DNA-methyltransferase